MSSAPRRAMICGSARSSPTIVGPGSRRMRVLISRWGISESKKNRRIYFGKQTKFKTVVSLFSTARQVWQKSADHREPATNTSRESRTLSVDILSVVSIVHLEAQVHRSPFIHLSRSHHFWRNWSPDGCVESARRESHPSRTLPKQWHRRTRHRLCACRVLDEEKDWQRKLRGRRTIDEDFHRPPANGNLFDLREVFFIGL